MMSSWKENKIVAYNSKYKTNNNIQINKKLNTQTEQTKYTNRTNQHKNEHKSFLSFSAVQLGSTKWINN